MINRIRRDVITQKYIKAWAVTGKKLQMMFAKYYDECLGRGGNFCWLRTDIITPSFDSLNFSYKNVVFSVLIDFLDDNGNSLLPSEKKLQQIKICKQNNMIPCLFKIYESDLLTYNDGWNLYNSETEVPIEPQLFGDRMRTMKSNWELCNWAISLAKQDLELKGFKVLSYTDMPGVNPQLWFENENREKSWLCVCVVVNGVFIQEDGECSLIGNEELKLYTGYKITINIDSCNGGKVWRGEPAEVSVSQMYLMS